MSLGETTFLSVFFVVYHADWLEYVLYMLSPQFSVFYAFLKIKLIFLDNGECMIFSRDLICQMKPLQKCCSKCGVLQACFERRSYFTFNKGVLEDIIALIVAGTVYFTILMLWEYRIIKKIINKVETDWIFPGRIEIHEQMPGLAEEKRKVMEKVYQLRDRDVPTANPFGEYLLVNGVSLKQSGVYTLTNIYVGVGRGGALAVSGLERHGRTKLCELLAGFRLPTGGDALVMSKFSLWRSPHKYSQQVSLCCGRTPLPPWLTVRQALELIAVLRGVPREAVKEIVRNYIDALDLSDQTHVQVRFLSHQDRQRFHFLTAVIAAPPVIILDEYVSQHQAVAVREAIYSILYHLNKRGHAVIAAASTVRLNLPVSDRLAILLNGNIYDIDHIDRLIQTYGTEGFIVVVHLKNDVDVTTMFGEYFDSFHINDATEVLVNVQVYDAGLDWAEVFSRMERLQSHNHDVYSYIITSVPIDFIYNSIILKETWNSMTLTPFPCIFKRIFSRGGRKSKRQPTPVLVENLKTFAPKYSIKYLNDLPWSVVFHK